MRKPHWKRRIQAAFGQDARTRGEFIAMAGLTAEEVAAADRESVLPGRVVVHLEGERHAEGRPNVTDDVALVSCRACYERATGKSIPRRAWPRPTSAEHGEPDAPDDPDHSNAQRVDFTRKRLEHLARPTGRAERSAR